MTLPGGSSAGRASRASPAARWSGLRLRPRSKARRPPWRGGVSSPDPSCLPVLPLPGDLTPKAGSSTGRLLQSAAFAVAGATPGVALATDQAPYVLPMLLWVLLVLLAGRLTIRPLAR